MTESLPVLGYDFADPALLDAALTHRSAGRPNNERLEFLGDAVLNGVVSEALYLGFPRAPEGELTRWRSELVREATLAALAREVGLGDAMRLGPGELKSGGFRRDSILADTLEAIFGAIYLDRGWEAARRVVTTLLATRLQALEAIKPPKDAKTRLQEWLQAQGLPLPTYEISGSIGSDHEKVFFARCSIDALSLRGDGEGSSRRAAETSAAAATLALIESGAYRDAAAT